MVPYIEHVDMVLIMTVEPGFGGQKFMTDMMPKVFYATLFLAWVIVFQIIKEFCSFDCGCLFSIILTVYDFAVNVGVILIDFLCIPIQVQYLRQKYRDLDIEVDGGVGPATIQACAEASRTTVLVDNPGALTIRLELSSCLAY